MKFDIKNKMKDIKKDDFMTFFQEKGRYVAAVVLFIVLILVLVKCTGKNGANGNAIDSTESTEVPGADGVYEVNANDAINTLINSYFTAYAGGDTDTIATLASPLSDNEKSYIAMFSQYVEAYQNISCYTKQGLDDKSYLVSVYLEIKFAGVDTAAPGLDFFYVQTNDDGSLYINNVYSQYNLLSKEEALDTTVERLINKFEQQDDVVALQSDVQSKYEAAVAADANLATMVNTTIADAYNTWAAQIAAAPTAEEQAAADAAAAEQAAADQAAADAAAAEQAAADQAAADAAAAAQTTETVYTTDTVKVRAEANANADVVELVPAGQQFTRTGTTEDGWSQVDYNGTAAYIKSDYLTTDGATASTSTATPVGTTVQLKDSTNVRSAMSETADKVGVAYAGETVTVVESYAEGWSKVTWNGQTGYIKSDLLQ